MTDWRPSRFGRPPVFVRYARRATAVLARADICRVYQKSMIRLGGIETRKMSKKIGRNRLDKTKRCSYHKTMTGSHLCGRPS